MGLLSRTPRTKRPPRPARPPRVRVRLTPQEIKSTTRLAPVERKIGLGLALYGPAATVFLVSLADLTRTEKAWRIVLSALLGAAYAVCAKRTNRMVLGLAGLGFMIPMSPGPLLVYPYLGFMMFMMFRQSGDRRKLMDARVASGDIAPIAERRRKETAARNVDATGRAIPLPSKRYTPPKYRPPRPKPAPPAAGKGGTEPKKPSA